MDTYPFTTAQQWEQHGHLRGTVGNSSYKVGKLKNPNKVLPVADKTQCTVETRKTRKGFEWFVYTPNYWFYINDSDVFERVVTFK